VVIPSTLRQSKAVRSPWSAGALPTVRFEAKPDAGGDAMFSADVELICAATL
jgi:hypothetical protein